MDFRVRAREDRREHLQWVHSSIHSSSRQLSARQCSSTIRVTFFCIPHISKSKWLKILFIAISWFCGLTELNSERWGFLPWVSWSRRQTAEEAGVIRKLDWAGHPKWFPQTYLWLLSAFPSRPSSPSSVPDFSHGTSGLREKWKLLIYRPTQSRWWILKNAVTWNIGREGVDGSHLWRKAATGNVQSWKLIILPQERL